MADPVRDFLFGGGKKRRTTKKTAVKSLSAKARRLGKKLVPASSVVVPKSRLRITRRR